MPVQGRQGGVVEGEGQEKAGSRRGQEA